MCCNERWPTIGMERQPTLRTCRDWQLRNFPKPARCSQPHRKLQRRRAITWTRRSILLMLKSAKAMWSEPQHAFRPLNLLLTAHPALILKSDSTLLKRTSPCDEPTPRRPNPHFDPLFFLRSGLSTHIAPRATVDSGRNKLEARTAMLWSGNFARAMRLLLLNFGNGIEALS